MLATLGDAACGGNLGRIAPRDLSSLGVDGTAGGLGLRTGSNARALGSRGELGWKPDLCILRKQNDTSTEQAA